MSKLSPATVAPARDGSGGPAQRNASSAARSEEATSGSHRSAMRCRMQQDGHSGQPVGGQKKSDIKGNPLEKTRWVISDDVVPRGFRYWVDWTPLHEGILDTRPYTTTLAYDALNRVRHLLYPEDAYNHRHSLTPYYDRAGTLTRMDLGGTPMLERIAYNAKGQRLLVIRPNGFHTRYVYDPVTFRLQRIRTERFLQTDLHTYVPQSGNVRQDTGYAYDLGGNILQIKERVSDCGINGSLLGSNALDKTFAYDPLKRLLKATGREGGNKWNGDHWLPINAGTASPNANHVRAYTRRYSYDKVGNVLDLVHQATSNNYTRHYNYFSGKNHLASIDSGGSPPSVNAAFLYDFNGNLTKTDTTRYHDWNAGDEMVFFKFQTGSGPLEIQSHHFYAGGQRVKKLIRNSAGNVLEATVYIDGIFEHRYSAAQSQTSLLVMDGRSKIATVRIGDDMDGGTPPVTYELEDHLGSIAARLDFSGGFVDSEEYYPFGESSLRQYGLKRYGYVGKEYELESGLLYYGARFYAAWTCRFISVDPLAASYAHLNPYNYAGNKPIGDLDIDGMQGTGDTQTTQPRVDGNGKDSVNRPRQAVDTNYEVDNLPRDPHDGHIKSYYYSPESPDSVAQIDYEYDAESQSWSSRDTHGDGYQTGYNDVFRSWKNENGGFGNTANAESGNEPHQEALEGISKTIEDGSVMNHGCLRTPKQGT